MPNATKGNILVDVIRLDGELIRAICQRECILFVGSGLSANVNNHRKRSKLPTWEKLLDHMLDAYKKHDLSYDPHWAKDVEDLIHGVAAYDPASGRIRIVKDRNILLAAQELKERLSEAKLLSQFIDEWFNPTNLMLDTNHKRIANANFRAIITTNFDHLLEDGFQFSKKLPLPLDKNSLTTQQMPLRPSDPGFIFYLHGDYEHPDDLVLGLRDYQQAMFNSPGYRQFIETIFSVYTVLFIGFSGNDPHLESILDQLASFYGHLQPVHYLLVAEGNLNMVAQSRLQKDRRVRVLEYENSSKDHKTVTALLDYLSWLKDCSALPQSLFTRSKKAGNRLNIVLAYGGLTNLRIMEIIGGALFQRQHHVLQVGDLEQFNANESVGKLPKESQWATSTEIAVVLADADCIIVILGNALNNDRRPNFEMLYAQYWSQRRKMAYVPIAVGGAKIPEHLNSPDALTFDTVDDYYDLISPADIQRLMYQINIIEQRFK